jgi:hypothetical protein
MALGITNAIRSTLIDTFKALFNSGTKKFYSGTRPATADTALSGNTLLATITYGATAFAASTNGVCTNNAVASNETNATAGTATFCRNFKSDGTTVIGDQNVGTSGSDVNIAAGTTFTAGASVTLATGAETLTQT